MEWIIWRTCAFEELADSTEPLLSLLQHLDGYQWCLTLSNNEQKQCVEIDVEESRALCGIFQNLEDLSFYKSEFLSADYKTTREMNRVCS